MNPTAEFLGNKNEERLSWADLQLYMLKKIFDERMQGTRESYKSAVNALELTLAGHRDDEYTTDIRLLNTRLDVIRAEKGSEIADLMLFDGKLEALTELIYRVNRGLQRIREHLENSHLVKEIANKITQGIGQNIFITGEPGQGKSNTSMALAIEVMRLVQGKFTTRNIVFNSLEFTQTYNNKKKVPHNSFIIYEEAGVGNNSKDSQKELNKKFNRMLQTIRKQKKKINHQNPSFFFFYQVDHVKTNQ